jgi:DNA processing protein
VEFRVVGSTDPGYPSALTDAQDLRVGQLYVAGDLSHAAPPAVAIVGTRNATPYGLRITRKLAGALAQSGVSIISGMARGIDAAAHRAALEAGGRTVAVLGTGIDVPYPAGHRGLHQTLVDRACVISESGPGVPADKGSFPRRNRIIAGLASVTIVVEAGVESGALITARLADRIGRTVAAVPGPIDSPESQGCNRLIVNHAQVITGIADALSLLNVSGAYEEPPILLSDIDGRVWKALANGPLDPDAIAVRTRLTTRECLGAITSLELGGYVESLLTGEIRRR